MNYRSILEDIEKSKQTYQEKIKRYENAESWSMAYLSLWVTLEDSIKKMYGIRVRQELLPQILEWKDYLEGDSPKAPNKITNFFSVDPFNIPSINQIKEMLGECPVLREVLDSKNRWRKRRNTIAHSAEEFGRENTYREYKEKLHEAIDELEQALRRLPE